MKVTVEIIGGLAVPPGHKPDGEGRISRDLPDGASLADLMADLGLPDGVLTLVRSTAVPRGERTAHTLSDGDAITVFPPLKGG